MSDFLKDMHQYPFTRDGFVKTFEEVFTFEQLETVLDACVETRHANRFLLTKHEEDYYVIHLESGTVIGWYKHLGRINVCSKPDATLDDLKEFLVQLRYDLFEKN